VPRGASPALLRFPESNRIVAQPNDRVERQLVVRLVALAREARSVPPETRAAEILVAAHPALCHNANVGGLALALGLRELYCE